MVARPATVVERSKIPGTMLRMLRLRHTPGFIVNRHFVLGTVESGPERVLSTAKKVSGRHCQVISMSIEMALLRAELMIHLSIDPNLYIVLATCHEK